MPIAFVARQLPLPPQVPKPLGSRQSEMLFELQGCVDGQPTVGCVGSHSTAVSPPPPPPPDAHAPAVLHDAAAPAVVSETQHTSPEAQFSDDVH